MWTDKIQDFLEKLPKESLGSFSQNEKVFSLQLFFEQLNPSHYDPQDLIYLDLLVKKLEVSKKLFNLYHKESFLPIGDDKISLFLLYRIFCHYLGAFLYTKDPKFLNTLLKLSSNTLAPDWQIPLSLKTLFEEFLDNDLQRN